MNFIIIALLLFTSLVINLPVISPVTITVIERNKKFVIVVVAFYGGFFRYSTSKITGFFVTHFERFLFDLSYKFPSQ